MVCWNDFPQRYAPKVTIRLPEIDSVERDYDVQDSTPKILSYTKFDIFVVLLSVVSFVMDTGSDAFVAYIHYDHYRKGKIDHLVYFILTILFVLIPSLTMMCFSLRWYLIDAKNLTVNISRKQWIMRSIFLFLQFGPVLRYIDSLQYGIKSQQNKEKKQKQKEYFQEMLYEDVDATLLRLFESFMEAAPQLLLHIYVLSKYELNFTTDLPWTVIVQIVSVFISLGSISWALSAYFRALRFSLSYKKNMNWAATVVYTAWHFFDIGARMLVLGVFTSVFTKYIAAVCILHWFVMTCWIVSMKTNFCVHRLEEVLYNAVVGIIFIFCYFNPIDTPTRRRYLFYYVFMFIENTVLLVIWCYHVKDNMVPVLVVYYTSFFVGLLCMIIYYLYLHPTGNIKVCSNWIKVRSKPSIKNRKFSDSDDKSQTSFTIRL